MVGAKFAVESDPIKASVIIRRHIETKRKELQLPYQEPDLIRVGGISTATIAKWFFKTGGALATKL